MEAYPRKHESQTRYRFPFSYSITSVRKDRRKLSKVLGQPLTAISLMASCPAMKRGSVYIIPTHRYTYMYLQLRTTVKQPYALNRLRGRKGVYVYIERCIQCIASNFSKRLTPVLFVARCPATRWRHRSRWQLRRRRRLHRTGRRVPAFPQQPGRRARCAQLRDLKMTAVLQLLLPVQHSFALHVERLGLLEQFHRALPLPCST